MAKEAQATTEESNKSNTKDKTATAAELGKRFANGLKLSFNMKRTNRAERKKFQEENPDAVEEMLTASEDFGDFINLSLPLPTRLEKWMTKGWRAYIVKPIKWFGIGAGAVLGAAAVVDKVSGGK